MEPLSGTDLITVGMLLAYSQDEFAEFVIVLEEPIPAYFKGSMTIPAFSLTDMSRINFVVDPNVLSRGSWFYLPT